jgi:hypothetical protein
MNVLGHALYLAVDYPDFHAAKELQASFFQRHVDILSLYTQDLLHPAIRNGRQ